jgi:hypothetical protein
VLLDGRVIEIEVVAIGVVIEFENEDKAEFPRLLVA